MLIPTLFKNASVCLSRYLSPKPSRVILPNLLHHFPLYKGCARAALFFCASVRASVVSPFVCHYLFPNHWTEEFNQTCYINFPHGKNMREQHYIYVCPSVCPSVRPSYVHLSVTVSSIPLGGIQPNLLHHVLSW